MTLPKPLRIFIERSMRPALRQLIERDAAEFQLVTDLDVADLIIFEDDKPSYIRKTAEFRKWPAKCVVIGETDEPTYFLPGCYPSNSKNWLGRGRAITIPYFLSQVGNANPFIEGIAPLAPRKYLYSFRGGATSWVRKKMFRNLPTFPDTLIQDSNFYRHWNEDNDYATEKLNQQKGYADILEQSSFVLCPRGAGISSIRLFEVMQAGRVPVIIADGWIPVEKIPWNDFSIFIDEAKVLDLDGIIRAKQDKAKELGAKARQAWVDNCSPGADSAFLANSLRALMDMRNEKREAFLRSLFPILELGTSIKNSSRSTLRTIILRGYALLGKEFPYSLNRPAK